MSEELAPKTTLSHYRIVSKLGAGGMGEVYLAEDTRLDRKVALKILPRDCVVDKDRMMRFVREAKSASALNHPNIITIYEIGESEGTHFIATEFIDGRTLNDYAKRSPLPLKTVLEIAIQIASALDEAHTAGIVHRDMKPDNVMVRANGMVKILDFGIAKLSEARPVAVDAEAATALKPQSTSPGMIIGTANYMSPEQAKGKEVDARTDIFSFGVVLYEMTAGVPPFEGDTAMEKMAAILHKEPKPLPEKVPIELKRIIQKCLRKERDERYQTIKDVVNDLKDVKRDVEVHQKRERIIVPDNDEPKTQILQATTVDEIRRATDKTAAQSSARKYVAIGLAILLISALGFFGYRYFKTNNNQIESIAVMPFVNESGNQDVEYLSDGMTETLIKSLSQLPNLNVKARSSVFRYKGKETNAQTIGKELNVQAILNGRVVQRGDQLTLSLELIDAQTENVIWSEQYNRKQIDLVSLQSEIAREVSAKLKTKLTGEDQQKLLKTYTGNPEAYQLYLKGRYFWNKRDAENLKKAIDQFKAAAEKDQNFALAYAGLADCYAVLPYYDTNRSSELVQQANPYAIRAVEIDDSLAEAHTSLAYVAQGLWNWAQAEKGFKRAIELNPNYSTAQFWYGRFQLRLSGRGEEGMRRLRRAQELEPFSLVINENILQQYIAQGDLELAIEQGKRLTDLDANHAGAHFFLSHLYLKKGLNAEAEAEAEKCAELSKGVGRCFSNLGFVRAVLGKRSEALAIIKNLEEKYAHQQADATLLAAVYAGLGEKDRAFEWLEKAFQDRSSLLIDSRLEFPFASLYDDPRYQALLKRMNLPE